MALRLLLQASQGSAKNSENKIVVREAFIHWPINGPPRLVWYSQKALNDAILKTYEGHQPDVKLYTALQLVGREPMTHAQAKAPVSKYGNTPTASGVPSRSRPRDQRR